MFHERMKNTEVDYHVYMKYDADIIEPKHVSFVSQLTVCWLHHLGDPWCSLFVNKVGMYDVYAAMWGNVM